MKGQTVDQDLSAQNTDIHIENGWDMFENTQPSIFSRFQVNIEAAVLVGTDCN